MKTPKYFLALTALLLSIAATTQAKNITHKPAEHPRLFYTAEKIAQLHQRLKTDDTLKEAWHKQLELADRLLEAELVSKDYAEGGKGQHGNYKRPSSQIHQMAGALFAPSFRVQKTFGPENSQRGSQTRRNSKTFRQ